MQTLRASLLHALIPLALVVGACAPAPSNSDAVAKATVIVDIPPRSSTARIAQILHDKNIIHHPRIFRLEIKLMGHDKNLKAGEYELFEDMPVHNIISILSSGRVRRHRVTIPEGWTAREIAGLLVSEQLTTLDDFLSRTQDAVFLKSLELPASSVEGFLFPSTYFFARNQSLDDMLREMIANYRKAFTPELHERARLLGMSELQVVTLASIIEKETGQAAERPLISSIFHNRLRRGMRLQSDPTTIYGIADFNGNLTRKDLETYSPYNTYVIRGLPPGPIASPGRDSLVAAVTPAKTTYLYFVGRNDGTHEFTSTLKDHNRAVDRFQRRHGKKH